MKFSSICWACFVAILSCFAWAGDYHVSTSGDDDNAGTLAEPWKTVQYAAGQVSAGDTVYIHVGRYHEEVDLGALKGTEALPITFTAYNNEEVYISGTEPIMDHQWSQSAQNSNIWVTTLTEDIWQLFVDGKAMTVARWPNVTLDYMDPIEGYSDAPPVGSYWDRRSSQKPTFIPATGSTWGHIIADNSVHDLAATGLDFTGAVVKPKSTTFGGTEMITSHTAGSNEFDHTTVFNADKAGLAMSQAGYVYLSCHINCLDAPREWFYDKDTQQLYVWFEDGAGPEGRYIEGKTRVTSLRTYGAEYINFYGITLLGGNFELSNSRHIRFDECRFFYCGRFKEMLKEFGEYSTFNKTLNGGGDLFWYNCEFAYNPGSSLNIRTWNNQVIENCWFHNSQWEQTTYGSVSDKKGHDTTIRRCTFSNNGASNATKNAGDALFEYNHSYNFFFAGDSSGHQIPTGAQSTTVIRNSWTHDLYNRNGIRFDGDPAGIQCQLSRCVSVRNTRGFRLKGDQHQIYNITGLDNSPKSDINIAHMKFYGYENPETGEITNDPLFGWPKADGRRGSLPYHGNENSIVKNIAGQVIDDWSDTDKLVVRNPDNEVGIWHGLAQNKLLKEQLRDPDNLDFRPCEGSELIDAGFEVAGITDGFVGAAPDIGAYEYGEPNYWIPGCKFKQASTPIPPDGSTTVKENADLMWLEGRDAVSHNVYFGADLNEVTDATTESPEYMGNQTNNIFDPNVLENDTLYYWRIDTVTSSGVVAGKVWLFAANFAPLYPTVKPTDDTWVRKGQAWNNCTSSELHIRGGNRWAYLKFDASALEDIEYLKVILRLHALNSFVDTTVHTVSDTSWNECVLTGYDGGTPTYGDLLDTLTDITAGTWNDFDVTGHAAGPGVYAFRLSTSGDENAWHSGDSSYKPQLIFIPKINHPPYFTSVSIHEPGATVGVAYSGTIGDMVNDIDGDELTITKASGPMPDWLVISPNGTLSGTPGPEHVGSSQWIVCVDDGSGETDEAIMDIVVNMLNDPDINGSGKVDLGDFAILVSRWMDSCVGPSWCGGADINAANGVNVADMLILAYYWLD